MTKRIKEAAKKHWLVALIGLLTSLSGTANIILKNAHEKELQRQNEFEVFFSNYQDKIDCENQRQDSLIRNKHKCNE